MHEEYDPEMIDLLRGAHPGLEVLSHPECNPGVLARSDFVGSTSQLLSHMQTAKAPAYLMLTECGLTGRLEVEMPETRFVGTCSLCKYMKSNTLVDIRRVLLNPTDADRIVIDEEVREGADRCIREMFRYAG